MKRKIFALLTIVALTAVFAAGCVKTNGDGVVQNIFENFSSTGEYVSAEAKLRLGEGQTFSGYDAASNTFIIKEPFFMKWLFLLFIMYIIQIFS